MFCSLVCVSLVCFCLCVGFGLWVGLRFVSLVLLESGLLRVKVFRKKKTTWNYPNSHYYWCEPLLILLSRIYLYTLVFICNHLWESLFYENLFESFLSVKISSYWMNIFIRENLFFNPSCLWKSFLIYAYLWESLLSSMFWQQFWYKFFEGAIFKCLHVPKCIFWGSNYLNFLINGYWLMWLLLDAFMTAD